MNTETSAAHRTAGPKQRRINELENALYRESNRVVTLKEALRKIREFPNGWERNLSITDFIDEVMRTL